MKKLHLLLRSTEGILLDKAVDHVQLPAAKGLLGILPGHMSLLSNLTAGVLFYEVAGKKHRVPISGGLVEVNNDRVEVLM